MRNTQIIRTVWLLAAFTGMLAAAEIPKPDRRIVISLSNKELTLFEGEELVRVYDVAVGKPSTPTPSGSFAIVNRIENPTWYGHGKPVHPGPHNPLGTRWLGLSKRGYGIHGTNEPLSIGKAASHGCVRMRNHDVEDLFKLVEPGVTVELVD